MRLFLSGPMGSGKSTLSERVAARLRSPALDLDAEIVRRSGCSVAEIFAREGESGFRAIEREVVFEWLETHPRCVVALGGGTVTQHDVRRRLLAAGVLVTLDAPPEALAQRVGAGGGRPLLAGQDVPRKLAELRELRADAYAECHATIDTHGKTLDELTELAVQCLEHPPVVVPLGKRTYGVWIGTGVRRQLPARLRSTIGHVVLVTDAHVRGLWATGVQQALETGGHRVVTVELEPGEPHKNLSSVQRIWDTALDAEIDRDAWVVAVGGGVVGDMAGFAAATLLRGVRVGHVPTTLLAMVDSAVGGKTGFDTAHGKNLIGAFHQPGFVLCDIETLDTLPLRERRAGLAEVVKSAWLAGEQAVAMLEADAEALVRGDRSATERAVRMSVGLKAQIVTEDEREAGNRALLNLGHTLGHAIEAAQGYEGMLHGEAVALGMVAAFRVARSLQHARPTDSERMLRLLKTLGLPVDLDTYLTPDTLRFVGSDKKRQGKHVRFVVPAAPGATRLAAVELSGLSKLLSLSS